MLLPRGIVSANLLLMVLIVLLAVNALISYHSARTVIANENRVSHTYEVLGDIEAMFSSVKDAQRGARGFVLIPQEQFLAPFDRAKSEYLRRFEVLRELMADNPRQQSRLAAFNPEVVEYLNYLDREVVTRRMHGFQAAEALIVNGYTAGRIDELGKMIDEMEGEERSLLAYRLAQTRRSIRTAAINFAVANAVAIALLVVAFILIVRGARHRQRYAVELEDRVQQRTAELEEANTALKAFTYSVSHDLRAPLRGMSGLGKALLEDYADRLDDMGRRYVTGIVGAARKMDALVDGLLLFSRVTRTKIDLQPVDLTAAVHEARGQLAADLESQNAHISIREPLPWVMAQRNVLVQVIANLVSNAVKFRHQGVAPQVTIWAEKPVEKVRLVVKDNGIGIAPEHQERIFGAFERLHATESFEGSGLGLAIVRAGLERMGGKVGVNSELGRGSEFWLELPMAKEHRYAG
ncbi:MAG: CHASE3 domain-containing protein [Acidobacteria bacterium]|nr:CHASE3 domain-containing protein [Acidobacteriota bacterium]